MSPRALVTGGAGFIGSHVADHCLRLGMQVVVADNLTGGVRSNVPQGAHFFQTDLRHSEAVQRLWTEAGPFDFIYHLAAYAAEGLSHFVRGYNYATNLSTSVNLINAAVNHRARHFVFISSIAVYGANQTPMRESTVPRPEDPYGISKYAVELDLEAAHRIFGLPYTIFRPHNVYGERQNIADRYRNVVGIFMNQLLNSQPMTLFGDGTQLRAFTHVDDVAPHIARAPLVEAARNEVFNVGSDQPYSVRQLAEAIAEAMGLPCQIKSLPARREVANAFGDHTKIKEAFAAIPKVGLKEGLARMAAWVKARGPAEPSRFENIEIRRELPESWR